MFEIQLHLSVAEIASFPLLGHVARSGSVGLLGVWVVGKRGEGDFLLEFRLKPIPIGLVEHVTSIVCAGKSEFRHVTPMRPLYSPRIYPVSPVNGEEVSFFARVCFYSSFIDIRRQKHSSPLPGRERGRHKPRTSRVKRCNASDVLYIIREISYYIIHYSQHQLASS